MAPSRLSLTHLTALTLATTMVSSVVSDRLTRPAVWAQTPGNTVQTIPIPSSLPADAVLSVDGSTSMVVPNETFKQRFLERFPNAKVELNASRTDEALEALVAGQLDVVASGRPLTQAERDRGLEAIPIDREKIAIIVGPNNPFTGDLTFDQFATMFYGDITDWSAVGGPARPLRFVDRPDYSDTRRALSQYTVFRDRPFTPGPKTDQVTDDTTETVIEALGDDGISYAVASQVLGRNDVRVLAMHQTLPDDPRYPYSQPRYYIYNRQNPSPEALAFLGFVTTAPGQEVVEQAVATATPAPAPTPEPTPAMEPEDDAVALVPPTAETEGQLRGRFPWWLLLIPLLGGLLWWLMKSRKEAPAPPPLMPPAAPTEPSRIILTPRNCRRAYAYWEVPDAHRAQERDRGGRDLMLRLYDVTERDVERHPPVRIEQYPVTENQQDLHVPIPVDDRDYLVELGYVTREDHWLPLAKSDPVRVPACPQVETVPQAETMVEAEPGLTVPGPALGAGSAIAGLGAMAAAAVPSVVVDHPPAPIPPRDPTTPAPTPAPSVPTPTPAIQGRCSIQTLKVHSRHHAVLLDGGQIHQLQDQVAVAYGLEPGSYILRIKEGSFSYGDPAHPGEPLVLLWIYGGPVTNLKTNVKVHATWSTLNGYADTLALEVDEPAQLRAFFIDTYPDNNLGQVTLSVVRL